MYTDPTGHTTVRVNTATGYVIKDDKTGVIYSTYTNPTPAPKAVPTQTATYNATTGTVTVKVGSTTKVIQATAPATPVPVQQKATQKVSSNTNGTVTVNNKKIDIYVPQITNGTNTNINSGGWTIVQTISGSDKNFNLVGTLLQSLGNLGDNTSNTVAENSHNTIQNNETIRKSGSDKGTLNLGASNEKLTGVGGLVIDTLVGAVKSAENNTNTTNFQVVIQQNRNQQRAIIEVGNPKSNLSTSGEYYVLPQGATGIGGLYVGSLEKSLKKAGYGEYIATGFFWRNEY